MENLDIEQFIEAIKNRPAIWDNTLEEYTNRELKRRCWNEIIDTFGGKDLVATQRRYTEILLRRKWKGLRGCFTRELRRQENLKSGTDSGPRKTEYLHFKQMLFLCNAVSSRPTRSESPDYIYYLEPSGGSTDKKKEYSSDDDISRTGEAHIHSDDDLDPLKQDAYRKMKKLKCEASEEDEDKLFLLSMLKTLQSIPFKKKITTKIKLMSVLEEATRNLED